MSIYGSASYHEIQFENYSLLSTYKKCLPQERQKIYCLWMFSMDPKYRSKVWKHFKLEKFAGIAQCNEYYAIEFKKII